MLHHKKQKKNRRPRVTYTPRRTDAWKLLRIIYIYYIKYPTPSTSGIRHTGSTSRPRAPRPLGLVHHKNHHTLWTVNKAHATMGVMRLNLIGQPPMAGIGNEGLARCDVHIKAAFWF